MEGRITAWWPERHYGFLIGTENPSEFFFHQSDLINNGVPPQKWTNVTFEIAKIKGRIRAVKVRVLPQPADVLAGKGGAE